MPKKTSMLPVIQIPSQLRARIDAQIYKMRARGEETATISALMRRWIVEGLSKMEAADRE